MLTAAAGAPGEQLEHGHTKSDHEHVKTNEGRFVSRHREHRGGRCSMDRAREPVTATEHVFSATGPLAQAIPGYKVRRQQIEMAQAVAEAIETRGVLIAEAGTGTGKTVRLPGAGAAVGRQGDRVHRHQDLAGSAVRSRHPDGAAGPARAGDGGAAQRTGQLRLPLPPRAQPGGRPLRQPRRRSLSAAGRALRQDQQDRRSQRARGGARGRRRLAAGDLDPRQLPGRGLSALQGLLRHGGAQAGARGRRGGGQPSSVLRRSRAARRGRGRAAARLQHRDIRRSAPASGYRQPVLRRERVYRAAA